MSICKLIMQHNYSCMQLIFVNMQLLRWFIEKQLNSIYNIIKTHLNVIRSDVYRISLLFWPTFLAFRHKFCMLLTKICHYKHLYLKHIFLFYNLCLWVKIKKIMFQWWSLSTHTEIESRLDVYTTVMYINKISI